MAWSCQNSGAPALDAYRDGEGVRHDQADGQSKPLPFLKPRVGVLIAIAAKLRIDDQGTRTARDFALRFLAHRQSPD